MFSSTNDPMDTAPPPTTNITTGTGLAVVSPGLAIAGIVLYILLFTCIYFNLILILCFKYKRYSHQSAFLFLCLLWAILRVILYSFYFGGTALANDLSVFPFWLLYCVPMCLQFATLCMLVLYFAQVLLSAKTRFVPNNLRWWIWTDICLVQIPHRLPQTAYLVFCRKHGLVIRLALGLTFLTYVVTDVVSAIVIHGRGQTDVEVVVTSRVLIQTILVLGCGIALGVCVYKFSTIISAIRILENKKTTVTRSAALCVVMLLIHESRAVYNVIVLFLPHAPGAASFNYGWTNVAEQDDINAVGFDNWIFLYFSWEFLPIALLVWFFRVSLSNTSLAIEEEEETPSDNRQRQNSLFDNPRRYDSDDDLYPSSRPSSSRPSSSRQSSSRPSSSRPSSSQTDYGSFSTKTSIKARPGPNHKQSDSQSSGEYSPRVSLKDQIAASIGRSSDHLVKLYKPSTRESSPKVKSEDEGATGGSGPTDQPSDGQSQDIYRPPVYDYGNGPVERLTYSEEFTNVKIVPHLIVDDWVGPPDPEPELVLSPKIN